MTGKVVKQLATFPSNPVGAMGAENATDAILNLHDNATESMMAAEVMTYTPIQIATVVTFMVGIWHVRKI